MKDTPFDRQAEPVLRILPDILIEEIFALKGGTAEQSSHVPQQDADKNGAGDGNRTHDVQLGKLTFCL